VCGSFKNDPLPETEQPMNRALPRFAAIITLLLPVSMPAQTNCEAGAGPLRPAQPDGIAVQEIIHRLSAQESAFNQALTHYAYTMDVNVQTYEGRVVDGEFRRVSDISYSQGKRMESVTFAPVSTLRRVSMTKQDFDDIDNRSPFVLTTQDLPQYDVIYLGQQKVDQLETYVFDVAPRKIEKGKRYFQGKIWVETRDFAVVKSCGRNVPDEIIKQKKRPPSENLSPTFVTYREQFEDKYWFPTYMRADEILHFPNGQSVRLREVIKYTKYRRADSVQSTVSNARP
jgi:hypothetical protein